MRQWKQFKNRFIHIHRREPSRHKLALGFAVGTLIAFTPTMGFQLVLAALVAGLLRANKAAAALAVFITNPFTLLPIYGFTFAVGNLLLPEYLQLHRADVSVFIHQVEQLSWTDFHSYLGLFSLFDVRFWAALWLGGILVGMIAAVLIYWIIRYFHDKHARKKVHDCIGESPAK